MYFPKKNILFFPKTLETYDSDDFVILFEPHYTRGLEGIPRQFDLKTAYTSRNILQALLGVCLVQYFGKLLSGFWPPILCFLLYLVKMGYVDEKEFLLRKIRKPCKYNYSPSSCFFYNSKEIRKRDFFKYNKHRG